MNMAAKIGSLIVAPLMAAVGFNASSTASSTIQVGGVGNTMGSALSCPTINRNLGIGERDNKKSHSVMALQEFLSANGYLTAQPSGFYGSLTVKAVKKFQEKNGIPATGFIGPKTLAFFLKGCHVVNSSKEVSIESLTPSRGGVGSTVVIRGTGFTNDNTILFDTEQITHIASQNGTTVRFTVPSAINLSCYYIYPACLAAAHETIPGTYNVSVKNSNGTSTPMSFTVTASSTTGTDPQIYSVNPSVGAVGSQVTITGFGFTADNTIHFGTGAILHASSTNGIAITCTTDPNCKSGIRQSIIFTISDSLSPYCKPGMMCAMMMQQITPGQYQVWVENSNGSSNKSTFVVSTASNNMISLNGIDAPTTVPINTPATFTVHAISQAGATALLHYGVVWGDEPLVAGNTIMAPRDTSVQSSATYTHVYKQTGSYNPVFTVTDDNSHTATASVTVSVTPIY